MTAPRDYRDFLVNMVSACRSIIRFTEGLTLNSYLEDEKTGFAVTRTYEILDEVVRHIPDALKQANPDIPWATMAAVGNRAVRGYLGSTTQSCSHPPRRM